MVRCRDLRVDPRFSSNGPTGRKPPRTRQCRDTLKMEGIAENGGKKNANPYEVHACR